MRELHYQPNAMARSLQGKSSQFIGLIFPNIQNPFFTALATEIEQLLFEKGYKVIIATSANNIEKEQQYLQMLAANQVEGIITSSHNLGIASYQDNFLPIVSYDRHLADNIPIVHEDNYRGGYLIGEYLVSQGTKNLLVLCDNDPSASPTAQRYVGFADAIANKSRLIEHSINFNSNEFASAEDAWKKVDEELAEFHAETDPDKKEQELGDVFFSLINYARLSGINPDSALEKTNIKFISRFQKMEQLALNKDLKLEDLSLEQMDELWEQAKKQDSLKKWNFTDWINRLKRCWG